MSNDTVKPRMSPAELTEACYAAAATAAISYVLGYGYEDIAVHDDGEGWPTTMSDVDTALWPIGGDPRDEPERDEAYCHIATIYEAGYLAALKYRGLGSHQVSLIGDSWGRVMLDDPKIWGAIEALAAYIEGEGDEDGFHSAMAMHDEEPAAIRVLTDAGLTPTYWADVGEDAWRERNKDVLAALARAQ